MESLVSFLTRASLGPSLSSGTRWAWGPWEAFRSWWARFSLLSRGTRVASLPLDARQSWGAHGAWVTRLPWRTRLPLLSRQAPEASLSLKTRQSGGANSTRKTWGALVGETGRSHLTSTVTLGHGLGLRAHGERKSWGLIKAARKETCPRSWPRSHLLLASAPGRMNGSADGGDAQQPPQLDRWPTSSRVQVNPSARVEAHGACYLTSTGPRLGTPWF